MSDVALYAALAILGGMTGGAAIVALLVVWGAFVTNDIEGLADDRPVWHEGEP